MYKFVRVSLITTAFRRVFKTVALVVRTDKRITAHGARTTCPSERFDFFENAGQAKNQLLGVGHGENHRRLEFEDVSVFAFCADYYSRLFPALHDEVSELCGRLLRDGIRHEIDANEKTHSSNVANEVVFKFHALERVQEVISHFGCMTLKLLLLDNVKHRVRDCQRYRIASVLSNGRL